MTGADTPAEKKEMPTNEAIKTLFLCFCRQYNQMGETLVVLIQLMVKAGLVPPEELGVSAGMQADVTESDTAEMPVVQVGEKPVYGKPVLGIVK